MVITSFLNSDSCMRLLTSLLQVDPVLSLTIIKCLTYGHLVQDLESLISSQGAGGHHRLRPAPIGSDRSQTTRHVQGSVVCWLDLGVAEAAVTVLVVIRLETKKNLVWW